MHKDLWKNLNCQKGQAIIYSIVFLFIATMTMMYMLERGKITTDLEIKKSADSDVQAISARLLAHFLNPGNCNANFYSVNNLSGSLTAINSCTSGTCHGVNTAVYIPQHLTTWDPNSTKLTNRVRFKQLNYSVFVNTTDAKLPIAYQQLCVSNATNDPTAPVTCNINDWTQHGWPATLKLEVILERRLSAGKSSPGKEIPINIYIPIVLDTSPGSPGGTAATKIIGCPRSQWTSVVY